MSAITTEQSAPKKKRATKKVAASKVKQFDHDHKPVCAAFATGEDENPFLVKIGDIYLSPLAIEKANSLMAVEREKIRLGK